VEAGSRFCRLLLWRLRFNLPFFSCYRIDLTPMKLLLAKVELQAKTAI